MNPSIAALLSVTIVSAISLIGLISLSLGKRTVNSLLIFLVSFAVGALFGDAFIHLIPESLEKIPGRMLAPALILGGVIFFFVLEKFLRWRHCHVPEEEGHVHIHPVATMNIFGDAVHNFIDGIIIAASYSVDMQIGLATTLAVVLHEIPQEMGDFGVLVHSGMPVKKALTYNFLCSLCAIIGAAIVVAAGPSLTEIETYALPFTAGGFIYIAGSDLIPELQHELAPRKSLTQLLSIVLGIGVMALLLLLG